MNTYTKTLAAAGTSFIDELREIQIEEVCLEDLIKEMQVTGTIVDSIMDYNDPLTILCNRETRGDFNFHERTGYMEQYPYHTKSY